MGCFSQQYRRSPFPAGTALHREQSAQGRWERSGYGKTEPESFSILRVLEKKLHGVILMRFTGFCRSWTLWHRLPHCLVISCHCEAASGTGCRCSGALDGAAPKDAGDEWRKGWNHRGAGAPCCRGKPHRCWSCSCPRWLQTGWGPGACAGLQLARPLRKTPAGLGWFCLPSQGSSSGLIHFWIFLEGLSLEQLMAAENFPVQLLPKGHPLYGYEHNQNSLG